MNVYRAIALLLLMLLLISCSMQTISTFVSTNTMEVIDHQKTISFSPSFTESLTITQSETHIQTLVPEIAKDHLLNLLSNNGDCRLPCFLKITPNHSTFYEADNLLFPFQGISTLNAFSKDRITIKPIISNDGIIQEYRIVMLFEKEVVSVIGFNTRVYKRLSDLGNFELIYDYKSFMDTVRYYLVANILKEYGKPSSVLLSTDGSKETEMEFNTLLLFSDKGLVINYSSKKQISGESALGCVSQSHFEINLFPEGYGVSFMEMISPYWNDRLDKYKKIEDVTSININGFYNHLINDPTYCISTPLEFWPIYSHT